ncbi:hypothetical protein NDU88_000178 [Pleurodeles waltl]|uniref:Secreted protein n=1 Tax=Pleurodeles waltl TaxID=8319 RepID=A0AAV7P048_PLEWA|nr:hypothetical protein NDU88_000178 [Pleurodeles waltl]
MRSTFPMQQWLALIPVTSVSSCGHAQCLGSVPSRPMEEVRSPVLSSVLPDAPPGPRGDPVPLTGERPRRDEAGRPRAELGANGFIGFSFSSTRVETPKKQIPCKR